MPAVDRVLHSDAPVDAVAFTAGGALAGRCQDRKIRVWDLTSGEVKRTIAFEKDAGPPTLTAGGTAIFVGADGQVKTLDVSADQTSPWAAGTKERLTRLALAKDLAAGSSLKLGNTSDGVVRVWDSSGRERWAVPAGIGGTAVLAFSHNQELLAASGYDADVRVWSTRDGELVHLVDELPVAMFAVAFSPDGKYLATAGADRMVYLFDTKTWKVARKLAGQPEMISAMAFSPDGRMLLTGGFSELTEKHPVRILLWDVGTGKVLRSLPSSRVVASVAFSADGLLAASANSEKQIGLWAVPGLSH